MNKLIELLNQYEREKEWLPEDFEDYVIWNVEWDDIIQWSTDPDARWYFKYYIISKDYEFIKRLVDNDKIDIVKWIKYGLKDGRDIENYKYDKNKSRKNRVRYWTEYLLMTLSIQNEPIAFLCSILK